MTSRQEKLDKLKAQLANVQAELKNLEIEFDLVESDLAEIECQMGGKDELIGNLVDQIQELEREEVDDGV